MSPLSAAAAAKIAGVRMPVYVNKKPVGSAYVLPVTREIRKSVLGETHEEHRPSLLAVFHKSSIRRHLEGSAAPSLGNTNGFQKILNHQKDWMHAPTYIQRETDTYVLVPVFNVLQVLVTVTVTRHYEVIDGEHQYRLLIDDIEVGEDAPKGDWEAFSSLAAATLAELFVREGEVLSEILSANTKPLLTDIKPSPQLQGYWEWGALTQAEKRHWGAFCFLESQSAEAKEQPSYNQWALA